MDCAVHQFGPCMLYSVLVAGRCCATVLLRPARFSSGSALEGAATKLAFDVRLQAPSCTACTSARASPSCEKRSGMRPGVGSTVLDRVALQVGFDRRTDGPTTPVRHPRACRLH